MHFCRKYVEAVEDFREEFKRRRAAWLARCALQMLEEDVGAILENREDGTVEMNSAVPRYRPLGVEREMCEK